MNIVLNNAGAKLEGREGGGGEVSSALFQNLKVP